MRPPNALAMVRRDIARRLAVLKNAGRDADLQKELEALFESKTQAASQA